jgi:SulP family sulfate permease
MSGVILLVAANLVDLDGIRHILRTDKSEAGVLAVTFLATLFVQMEFAIFCGVILSLLMYLSALRIGIHRAGPGPGQPAAAPGDVERNPFRNVRS